MNLFPAVVGYLAASAMLLFKFNRKYFIYSTAMSALMVQLDARPTDDQEVASSIPAGSATFFHID